MSAPIPGIHQYCDRWCERCSFTSRCAVFSSRNAIKAAVDDRDAFWNRMAGDLRKSMKRLYDAAEKQGVDLDNISAEEEQWIAQHQSAIDQQVQKHWLVRNAKLYVTLVQSLLKDTDLWTANSAQLLAAFNGADTSREQQAIDECREIIGWYMTVLPAKFIRALNGKIDNNELADPVQNDINGSARVGLDALMRSEIAWKKLFALNPDEDRIFPVFSLISKLRKSAAEEFPYAYAFIRPGFDDKP